MRHSIDRAAATLTAALVLAALAAAAPADGPDVDRRWLAKLDKVDRGMLAELVGHAPPPFSAELEWIGSDPLAWETLRGRVVVLQAWTGRSHEGRRWPRQAAAALERLGDDDVRLVLLHTPDGADDARTYLERRPAGAPVAVDHDGVFCDVLGVYREPVNVVIDRNGAVRYVGLSARGLRPAVETLVAEAADPQAAPPPFVVADAAPPAATFPPPSGLVEHATDFRGRRAPAMHVDRWLTRRPDAEGRVVVIDFWATWCGPCVASIPHMNELATAFADDVVVVGISDEQPGDFMKGLARRELAAESFRYALALDPSGRMKKALAVKGIPHAIVMSSDWIVRWQGHPGGLHESTLRQIVAANAGAPAGGGPPRARWAAELGR
jgi:thiol-disulfide isomerase/thioredoxin